MLRLACSFDSSIGRFQLEDYVRELQMVVFAFDDGGQQVLVGRIAATQVHWAEEMILATRVSLLVVRHFAARMSVLQALLDRRFWHKGALHMD